MVGIKQKQQYKGISHSHHHLAALNKISTKLLLTLNRLEQRLEVSSPETLEVVSLDNLDENSRAVHQVL